MSSSDEDSLKRAFQYAYRLLSIRDRAKEEIRAKLIKKGFESVVVERVISRLQDDGYLDDGRFAKGLLKKAIKDKCYGVYAIRPYLLTKGIGEDTIQGLQIDRDDIVNSATEFVRKKTKTMKGLSTFEIHNKLTMMLRRRGHDAETIKEVLKRVL